MSLFHFHVSEEGSIPEDLKKPPFIKKLFVVVNKVDKIEDEENYGVFLELSELKLPTLGVSTQTKRNLTAFVEKIYELSAIIRVYTKAPGKEPDLTAPL